MKDLNLYFDMSLS